MFRKTQMMIKEFSDTLNAISQAYSDENILPRETHKIRNEWEDLKRAGETLVCECEMGAFRQEQPRKKSGQKRSSQAHRKSR
jgi:hypothetical protein